MARKKKFQDFQFGQFLALWPSCLQLEHFGLARFFIENGLLLVLTIGWLAALLAPPPFHSTKIQNLLFPSKLNAFKP